MTLGWGIQGAGKVALTICYYQRFNSRHRTIKELVAKSRIGTLTAARINFSERFPPRPDFRHHRPRISGGGVLMDLGVHCVDLLRFLCGPVESVSALVETLIEAAPISSKDSSGSLTLSTADGVEDLSPADGVRPHVALLETFGQAIVLGETPPIGGEEGVAGLAVIEAAYRSARDGVRVQVEP